MRQNCYEKAEEYVRRYHLDKIGMRVPTVFLDLHPAGRFAALQGYTNHTDQAAVFDLASGQILWMPEAVPALCWLPYSGDILLIRALYQYDSELHEGQIKIVSPFQSEFIHYVERWTWPERHRLSGCELTLPTGWPTYIAVSPRGDLAVVQWQEQDDSGLELFALTETGTLPLPAASYRAGTQLTEFALFSPDGRYLILVCTTPLWWQPDNEAEDFVSPGGRFQVGEVVVMSTELLLYNALPIYAELPVGWVPDDPDSAMEDYMLRAADFTDPTHLLVQLKNDYNWIVEL